MSRAPSKEYLKAHKALLDLWGCIDSMGRRKELESLLDEVNACDKRLRRRDPSLSTYQVNELTGLMSIDEIRRNQQSRTGGGTTVMEFDEEIYGEVLVRFISSRANMN